MAVQRSTLSALSLRLMELKLAGVALIVNAISGAILISIDAPISRMYFGRECGGLMFLEDSIPWGFLTGATFGWLGSLIFATGVGRMTPTWGSYRLAVSCLCRTSVVVFVGWLLGGCSQTVLAAINPDIYEQTFHGVPPVSATLLRYAWVDGSTWGMERGLFLSPVVALVMFRWNWFRTQQAHRTEDPQAVECSIGSGTEDREAEVSKVEA